MQIDFTGTYNGQGYTITGLNASAGTGMFGTVNGAELINIVLVDATVNNATADNVAVLAGNVAGTSTISNIRITGATALTGNGKVGAIVGNLAGGTISDSKVEGTVALTGSASYVGGLVGYADSDTTVTGSSVENNVTITGSANYIGGVVGYAAESTHVINNSFGGKFANTVLNGAYIAGCIVGNETSDENYLYGKNSTLSTTSTTDGNAKAFEISGNTCVSVSHANTLPHLSHSKFNDFMAGKLNTKPTLTAIAPAHQTDVSHSASGSVSIYEPIIMTFDKPMSTAAIEDSFTVIRHDDNGDINDSNYYDKNDYNFAWTADHQSFTATLKNTAKYENSDYTGGYYENNRTYTVRLAKNTALDIFSNKVASARADLLSVDANSLSVDNGAKIEWTFKTYQNDMPQISSLKFVRNRRNLTAEFSVYIASSNNVNTIRRLHSARPQDQRL